MAEWWNEMLVLQQVMFIIGCGMAVILLIQIVMMLIGIGDDPSFDLDTSLDPDVDGFNSEGVVGLFGLKVFTVRSAVTFLAIGSWVCFTLLYTPMHVSLVIILSILAGCVASILMAMALKGVESMQGDGNINIDNAKGKIGEVYLTIPASRQGAGKVQIVLQERTREFDALTDNQEKLANGVKIRVSAVIDEATLLVEPV